MVSQYISMGLTSSSKYWIVSCSLFKTGPAVVAQWSKAQHNVQTQCELNYPGLNHTRGMFIWMSLHSIAWIAFGETHDLLGIEETQPTKLLNSSGHLLLKISY